MINELTTRQIAKALRDGASAEEVSEAFGVELAMVKLVAVKNEVGNVVDRDIDDDQLSVLRKHAYQLALGAADDATQARVTMFLLERDKPSKKASEGSPLMRINQAIMASNEAFSKLCKEMSGTQKPIDV